ncbi:MAG: S41 family peptidase [Deltaproteobacteria bacterium]|nr:MAG: S41 family peptidase [Deltaproteobacteria bacterium]
MTRLKRWSLTAILVATAYAGGAFSAHVSHATGEQASPYAPLSQMARVLVLLENQYVDPVERQRILDGAIKGMVAELDPHSAYMTPKEFALFNQDTEGAFGGIGVEVDFKDERVVVVAPIPGSPAARAGIRSGDRIIQVDGTLLRDMSVEKIIRVMRGPPKTQVVLTISRKGVDDLITFELLREHIKVRSVEGKRLAKNVVYLRLKQFQQGTHQELLKEIGKARQGGQAEIGAVILDMRSNPGGLIDEAEAVADEFLPSGAIFSTRHRGRILDEVWAHRGGALSTVPLVVLVNEYSASSAELVAGALQDNGRATTIGAKTFGKGSVQTIYQLPGGAGLRLTTMRYYTPNGRAIQAAGIIPEIAIKYQTKDGGDPTAIREQNLQGHLAAEGGPPGAKDGKVLIGGKRPDYTPISKLPADPRKGDDFALQTAYQTALEMIAKR